MHESFRKILCFLKLYFQMKLWSSGSFPVDGHREHDEAAVRLPQSACLCSIHGGEEPARTGHVRYRRWNACYNVSLKLLIFFTEDVFPKLSLSKDIDFSSEIIDVSLFCRYIMTTSVVGLYSIPPFRAIRPKKNSTSLTAIIINCSMILMLSSALPVLANTLGNFFQKIKKN